MIKFIGFYDYTIILTCLSLISSVFGIIQTTHGNYTLAIICLAISGACDAFDGKVARNKKNRTEDEKSFGIQLDSLSDVVCFGAFPAILCYKMGVNSIYALPILFFYCLCAVIRLAFFNVLEQKRQSNESIGNTVYRGLPVTSISIIFPLVYSLRAFVSASTFVVILHFMLTVIGFLFILDFSFHKPDTKTLIKIIGFAFVFIILALIYSNGRIL